MSSKIVNHFNNSMSLYIPRVMDTISRNFIKKTFEDLGFGIIDRVDKKAHESGKYNYVFIHFKCWNYSTMTQNFQESIRIGKTTKVVHDDPWFWIVLENKMVETPAFKLPPFVSIAPALPDFPPVFDVKTTPEWIELSDELKYWSNVIDNEMKRDVPDEYKDEHNEYINEIMEDKIYWIKHSMQMLYAKAKENEKANAAAIERMFNEEITEKPFGCEFCAFKFETGKELYYHTMACDGIV